MDVFRCEVMRASEVCKGNLIKTISRGEPVLRCDKCQRETSLRDFENKIDNNPATMGETWFRR